MKAFIRILAACSISGFVILTGCSINRADSLRMLDHRADYDGQAAGSAALPALREGGLEGFHGAPVPVRTRAQVAPVWIFPHETASRDYFWGGWISIVTEEPQWLLTRPGRLPPAPGITHLNDAGKVGGTTKKPGRTKKTAASPAPLLAPMQGPVSK